MNRSYTVNGHSVGAGHDLHDNREPGNGGLGVAG